MSRIGRLPITIPAGVTVSVDGQDVAVKGPKGELALTVAKPIEVSVEEGQVLVSRPDDEREVFAVMLMDAKHCLIEYVELFKGTIDQAAVYPREVVKLAMQHNAAAMIISHNHPSANPEPSRADELLTKRLKEALALVDVRVLDHIIVAGNDTVSFAERGLI